MSDDNSTTTTSDVLKLIVGTEGATQTGTFQVGSVTYTQASYVTPPEHDAHPVLEVAVAKPPNVTPQLHLQADIEPPRYEDGKMADPHGNLTNLAARGVEDDGYVLVVNVAGDDETTDED